MKALSKLEKQLKNSEYADKMVAHREDKLEKALAEILKDNSKLERVIESLDEDTKTIVKDALINHKRKDTDTDPSNVSQGTRGKGNKISSASFLHFMLTRFLRRLF